MYFSLRICVPGASPCSNWSLRDKISLAMENKNQTSDEAKTARRSDEDTAGGSRATLKPAIVEDPVLVIPVLTFGDDAPVLTSEQVEEMHSDFP